MDPLRYLGELGTEQEQTYIFSQLRYKYIHPRVCLYFLGRQEVNEQEGDAWGKRNKEQSTGLSRWQPVRKVRPTNELRARRRGVE